MRSSFLKAMILLVGITGIAMSYDYDWKNAEGYISVKQNGVVKNYVIVSSGNALKLMPINGDPSKVLKSKQTIIDEINKKGG